MGNGDILCEMRFHVPNNELEIYQEEREAAKAEERKKRQAAKEAAGEAAGEEEKKGGDDAEESEESEEEEMNAAKLFDKKIHQKANIGEFAGEVVASI